MPGTLTETERRVLDYLVDYLRRNTYQPSIREIGREFNIRSTKTVSELLQSMADKGWIERDPARSRGVRLLGVKADVDTVDVPVLSAVPYHLDLDRRLVPGAGPFAFLMNGDHLVEEGIRHGDLLVAVTTTPASVRDGDVLILRDRAATTVRRASAASGEIVLDAAAPGERPQRLSHEAAARIIAGRVVTVIRRLSSPDTDAEPQQPHVSV